MRPWVVAAIGLLIATSAIYALVTGVFDGGDPSNSASDEIDDRSRAELRKLLQESEESEAGAKP